ncbi:hypothetical protein EIP86_010612 [Pleurotus ostreatoroseus]|nr:hypothetical protein EIP86_010612 [Pleurotus ostreatoroseus]
MRAATSSRRGSSYREGLHTPTAPIPIPVHRKAANRHDQASSPDLIFHMSPDVAEETPLASINAGFVVNDGTRLHQTFGLKFASHFGHVKSTAAELPPYYDEPFMYSIPRLPVRSPPSHARTRSEVVRSPQPPTDDMDYDKEVAQRSTFSASSSSIMSAYPSHANRTPCSSLSELHFDTSKPLTSAFQNSLSSSMSISPLSAPSTSLEDVLFPHPISPPASVRGWKDAGRPVRSPHQQRKSLDPAVGANGLSRTSAAKPIVSFAQAGLNESVGSETASARKSSRTRRSSPLRARSPYPIVRGRRKSPARSRLKVSDEDIAGTLEHTDVSEKFGLEKFLAPGFPRRKSLDENDPDDELVERGRTRSRIRGGRRA